MFILSPAFSAVPPGELIELILPEPFPLLLSNLSPNPVIPFKWFCITFTIRSLSATRTFVSTGIEICLHWNRKQWTFLPPNPLLFHFSQHMLSECRSYCPIRRPSDSEYHLSWFLHYPRYQPLTSNPAWIPASTAHSDPTQVYIQYPFPVLPYSPIP